jgi:hypothetical protein
VEVRRAGKGTSGLVKLRSYDDGSVALELGVPCARGFKWVVGEMLLGLIGN